MTLARALCGLVPMPLTERVQEIVDRRAVGLLAAFEDAEVDRLAPTVDIHAEVVTVIATYRRPELLRRAVRSALCQTLTDHVVVVVDDGSGEPLDPVDLGGSDSGRLHVVALSRNSGVCGLVRNVGVRLSASTYVAFLDDDNWWEPDHLESGVHALEQADLSYASVVRVLPSGEVYDLVDRPFRLADLRWRNHCDASALVARRATWPAFSRLPRRIRRSRRMEDWALVRSAARSGLAVVATRRPTVRYLVHPDSYYTVWEPGSLAGTQPTTTSR